MIDLENILEKNKLPTREEIQEKLQKLLNKNITREEISDWAAYWVCGERLERVKDFIAWEKLKDILAADLKIETGEYFHDQEDFKKWLEDLRKAGPFIEKKWNLTTSG